MTLRKCVEKFTRPATRAIILIDPDTGNMMTCKFEDIPALYAGNIRIDEVHIHDDFVLMIMHPACIY